VETFDNNLELSLFSIFRTAEHVLGDVSRISKVVNDLKPGDGMIAEKVLGPVSHMLDFHGFNSFGTVGKAIWNLIDGGYKKKVKN